MAGRPAGGTLKSPGTGGDGWEAALLGVRSQTYSGRSGAACSLFLPARSTRMRRVRYLSHQPSPPLSDSVDLLWTLSDAPGHVRERIVPSGTVELVINTHDDEFRIYDSITGEERRFRGAIASGCYSRPFEFDTRAHARVLGVHFKPGSAARLLGAPPGALANAHVDLADLWGRSATELRERLCATPPGSSCTSRTATRPSPR